MKELISPIRPFSDRGLATASPRGEVESSRLLVRWSATKVSDGSILKLVKQFLKAPIVERVGRKQRITSNKTG